MKRSTRLTVLQWAWLAVALFAFWTDWGPEYAFWVTLGISVTHGIGSQIVGAIEDSRDGHSWEEGA